MNLAVLTGRVSANLAIRYTKKGVPVASFDIAVRKSFSRDAEGNYPTDFFHVVVWHRLAESCNKNLIKGRMVLVKGSIANDDYQDENGVKHRKTVIKASTVEFLDSRKNTSMQQTEESAVQGKDFSAEAEKNGAEPAYEGLLNLPDEEIPF